MSSNHQPGKTFSTRFRDFTHVASEIVIIVGLPLAVYQIMAGRLESERSALNEHEQVYNSLDAQYTDFLKLCLQHPTLDCFDVPENPPPKLGDDDLAKQRILYAVLIPMLEHAYLAYHGQAAQDIKKLTAAQWPGWELYAKNFMERESFRAVWKDLGREFDREFAKCLDSLAPGSTRLSDCDPWEGWTR